MEFLITGFIYPLSEPIILSEKLGFRLDNPHTDFEISIIEEYLNRAYESGYDYKFPIFSDEPIVTLEEILFNFREKFTAEGQYVADYFETYNRDSFFKFLAGIWVIARFDDEGLGQELREAHKELVKEGHHGFIMLEDDHPIIQNSKKLTNFCYLLSLLIHSEGDDYFGRSLLIDPEMVDERRPTERIWNQYLMFGLASQTYPEGNDSLNWIFLPYVLEKIVNVSRLLELSFNEGNEEKLLYIGGILKIVSHDTRDIKTRILLLTSILELLLTHNPNFSRFNVEDSINKQFQLKVSILVYLNDRNRDINAVRNRLKTIYAQRSNIAHGNFGEVNKYIKKLSKKEGQEEYFDDLVSDLYTYIRAVLEEYLNDQKFVDFLKVS